VYLFTGPGTWNQADQTREAIDRTCERVAVEIVTVDITDPISYGQILAGIRALNIR
jgi:hypothetical protein